MNKRLIDFYKGTDTDIQGRTFQSMIDWTNGQWERAHDSIQWLFPLPERSRHNPAAPIMDAETIEVFKTDATIRNNVLTAILRADRFFGFPHDAEDDVAPRWFRHKDHNLLRLTRIIRFLMFIGWTDRANELYAELLNLSERFPGHVSNETLDYWTGALDVGVGGS